MLGNFKNLNCKYIVFIVIDIRGWGKIEIQNNQKANIENITKRKTAKSSKRIRNRTFCMKSEKKKRIISKTSLLVR